MSDYLYQSECEIWDSIAANDRGEFEEALERRLRREATTNLLGVLRDSDATTDSAHVEVLWWEPDGSLSGCPRAGYFLAHVYCDLLDEDAPEAVQMANAPASRAEQLVSAELERRGELHGWAGWEISDVYAA